MGMPVLTLSRGDASLIFMPVNGWAVLPGVSGLDDPPRALIEVNPAIWDGSLHMASRYLPREVFLPLQFWATTTDDLRTVTRSLAALTDTKRGPVVLEVAHLDGTRRWVEGYLSAPFGDVLSQMEGSTWRRVGLTLRCGDPFWLGEEQSISFAVGGDIPQFLSSTFLPVSLADSQVVGNINIVNYSDAEAYPVWTLTGPCDEATVSMGEMEWTVPDGLEAAEVMTVDTRRGVQSVMVDEVAAWGRLGQGAQFAPLSAGDNPVEVTVTGATSATTLSVSWRERWLTAW